MRNIIALAVLCLSLSACSAPEQKPVGLGSGRDDFPKSPCACLPFYKDGKRLG